MSVRAIILVLQTITNGWHCTSSLCGVLKVNDNCHSNGRLASASLRSVERWIYIVRPLLPNSGSQTDRLKEKEREGRQVITMSCPYRLPPFFSSQPSVALGIIICRKGISRNYRSTNTRDWMPNSNRIPQIIDLISKIIYTSIDFDSRMRPQNRDRFCISICQLPIQGFPDCRPKQYKMVTTVHYPPTIHNHNQKTIFSIWIPVKACKFCLDFLDPAINTTTVNSVCILFSSPWSK